VRGYDSPEAGVFDGGEGCDLGVLAGTVLVENFLCLVVGYGDDLHRLMVFCSRLVPLRCCYIALQRSVNDGPRVGGWKIVLVFTRDTTQREP
jgi:hypothetical protein